MKTVKGICKGIEMEIEFTCPCGFDMWDVVHGYKGLEIVECPQCDEEFKVEYDADREENHE